MRRIYKIGLWILATPVILIGVLFSILLIWGAIEHHSNGFSKAKLEQLTAPIHYVDGISSSEMGEILNQVESWVDREEKTLDKIFDESSKAKQQSMAMDYVNKFDYSEVELIQSSISMLNCTDFQDKLSKSQQKRKEIVYAKIKRHWKRMDIVLNLFK